MKVENADNLVGNTIELTQTVNSEKGYGCKTDMSEILSALEDLKDDIGYLLANGNYMYFLKL